MALGDLGRARLRPSRMAPRLTGRRWPVTGAVTRAAIAVVGGAAAIRLGASLDHIFMAVSLGMMSFGLPYPRWQAWLQKTQPKLLVLWGKHDLSFDPGEPERHRNDVPKTDVHELDAGHEIEGTRLRTISWSAIRTRIPPDRTKGMVRPGASIIMTTDGLELGRGAVRASRPWTSSSTPPNGPVFSSP